MTPTGFGKYQEMVISIITVFLIVAAVAGHFAASALSINADFTFLDAAALLAIGALYGKTSAANGYAREARAAHARLDRIGAPPANDGSEPTIA